ncbi:MAG TPA: hypothetical protein VMQ62_11110 [Dongiaceae bacterium]|nr:hypothetical protein [Dongiaceae bacterium]
MDPGVVPLVLFVLLGIGGVVILFRDDPMFAGRRATFVMTGLAVAALLTPMQLAPFRSDVSIVHWSEFYHYLLATRYFHEVGYSGLYDATVVADHEDDPEHWNGDLEVRSLRTYDLVPRSTVLERAGTIRAPFTPERWEAFKRDVAVFRAALGDEWRASRFQVDHGYNGSPLTTLLLGTLSRLPFLDTRSFILAAAWGDTVLMIATALLVARWVGAWEGALLLFVWAVNPFNDFQTIGGAYLRYPHFVALLVMAFAWARGRLTAAGGALAVATALRVYPLFLAIGLAAQALLSPRRSELLPRAMRCLAAFAVVLVALALLTSYQPSPDGTNPWAPYAAKLRLHAHQLSYNVVSFQYLFFYAESRNAAAIAQSWQEGRNLNWVIEATKAFAAHQGGYLIAIGAALAALAVALRRSGPEEGLFTGLVLVFLLQHLSHYDWFVLSIVPFLFPGCRRAALALFLLFMLACLVPFLPAAAAIVDFRFYLLSLLMTVWMAATIALRMRPT